MNIKKRLTPEEPPSKEASAREAMIVRTSILGILANTFLAAFKAAVGLLSHSIAVTLDAVNNLSDAASSLITIVGTKLAGREPDKKHPFGHGRVEYLTSMLISTLVLYAGLTSFVESVKKIIRPDTPEYTPAGLTILVVAALVKFFLGRYVRAVGKRVDSDSLVNSGEDAAMDSLISASTLVAAAVYLLFRVSLEAWLGAAISLVIIRSGVEMLREAISRILGERPTPELVRGIRKTVCEFPGVSGAYDMVLHNYGPDTFQGSLHIEVPDTCSANQLDDLIREITLCVYQKHHVILTAIGVYSLNTHDEHAIQMRETLKKAVLACPYVLQMHGFYLKEEEKRIRFDVVVSFDAPDRKEAFRKVKDTVSAMYPDYTFQLSIDSDFSEA